MRKILILCAFTTLSFSMQAQEQWSMFSKVTATWCPNCGTYGWTMFKDGLEAMQDKNVLSWTLHHSGDLRNQAAEDLAENFQAPYQPRFYINNDALSVSAGNVSDKVKELEESVDVLNSFAPFVAVSNNAVFNGYNIQVESEFEFLEEVPGNYYIASYLIKDHVIANQSNQGSMADHRFVLTDVFGENSFGSSIATPVAEAGLTAAFVDTYDIEIEEADVEDYYVATVIWNFLETTQTYRVFNLTMSQVSFLPSSTIDPSLFDQYQVAIQNAVLNIETDRNEDYQVSIMNLEGKLISSKNCQGNTQIDLSQVNNQMILLNILEGDKQSTKQFFLK